MLRLFARHRKSPAPAAAADRANPPAPARGAASVEQLEGRVLYKAAPYVTNIVTDNRGEVIITTDRSLNPESVNTRSVYLFNVGADGEPLTADDIKMPIRPSYSESNRQLRIRTIGLPAGTTYFVHVVSKNVYAWDGMRLDGEFKGPGVRTGNGAAYGSLMFISKRDRTDRPTARFSTNYGAINVTLFKDQSPLTVQNFLNYANRSAWDGTFFHRSARSGTQQTPFVIQGGGFFVDQSNVIQNAEQDGPVANEPGISNTRGTIAMAKLDGDPNSATNQWFFNLGNNAANLDGQNGGFTVFGEINSQDGLDFMDRIAALDRVNAGGALNELPVNDLNAVQTRGSLDPQADVVSIRRVAIWNRIGFMPA